MGLDNLWFGEHGIGRPRVWRVWGWITWDWTTWGLEQLDNENPFHFLRSFCVFNLRFLVLENMRLANLGSENMGLDNLAFGELGIGAVGQCKSLSFFPSFFSIQVFGFLKGLDNTRFEGVSQK